MDRKIQFLASKDTLDSLIKPAPAKKFVPDWYKDLDRSIHPSTLEPKKDLAWAEENRGLVFGSTFKQCIPVRDYITSGYVIPLWHDIAVTFDGNSPYFAWCSSSKLMDWHDVFQIVNTPLQEENGASLGLPKLLSPWEFKTPKGYSTLFFSPRYSKSDIEILPAIVDTDTHHNVNFPFVYKGEAGDKIIYKGDPIVQLIPFKRESWSSEFVESSNLGLSPKFLTYIAEAYRFLHHKKKSFK